MTTRFAAWPLVRRGVCRAKSSRAVRGATVAVRGGSGQPCGMPVTKAQIVGRGLTNRCPNCGHHTLFPPRSFQVRRRCSECGTGFDRGDGFFLGPWILNYSVAVFLFVIPALVGGSRGLISWPAALIISGLGCTAIPVLLYRSTWSWWLMLYFYFLPGSLPANGGATGALEED